MSSGPLRQDDDQRDDGGAQNGGGLGAVERKAALSEGLVEEVADRRAQRYSSADICTSLVYKWRREARKSANASATGFAPVVIEASPVGSASQPSVGPFDVIVVEVNDARVRIGAGAPSALITATLKALRT